MVVGASSQLQQASVGCVRVQLQCVFLWLRPHPLVVALQGASADEPRANDDANELLGGMGEGGER